MARSPAAVIDSGLVVLTILDTTASEAASQVMSSLVDDRVSLYAPSLWRYEVTSVIHHYLAGGRLEAEEAEAALEAALNLSVNIVDEDAGLCRAAFHWASRLKQRAAYDGFYLALADQMGISLWTADQRLVNNARQLGVDWVYGIKETG